MLNDPRFAAEVELTIPFHDVDMMGVAWHGNYFRYFEIAREALLNQFDYGYRQMKASGYVRMSARCGTSRGYRPQATGSRTLSSGGSRSRTD